MGSPDVVVAGAGLIGLSCALELRAAGLQVTVVERGRAGRQASWAAAGMLAAHDTENPASLRPFAERSIALYPHFLNIIEDLGGLHVPFETEWTLEQADGWRHHRTTLPSLAGEGFRRIAEHSVDPRHLLDALLLATSAAGITLREDTPVRGAYQATGGITLRAGNDLLQTGCFLDCTGAWSTPPVHPAKGQMLKVHAPGAMHTGGLGNIVVRTPDVYLVPRLDGTVVIGATVEDAGFDRTVFEEDIQHLRREAAHLLPSLRDADEVERWSGLRPDTPDHLPILGRTGESSFVATGHFRNGVLLAPATAQVMAEVILQEETSVSISPFHPDRFTA